MTVYLEGSSSENHRLVRHAGIHGNYLPDSGGAVVLRTFEETTLSCSSWGRGSC
jgi:hypothetical protein